MLIFETFLISTFLSLLSSQMSETKIVDFHSDNPLFHPFVHNFQNYRTKDYLMKLLKRNLEEKLRKNRKLPDDREEENRSDAKSEKSRCNCKCSCKERNFEKRSDFVCESEGCFPNPGSCKQFYLCLRNQQHPIRVTCPRGFAFDSDEGKCTRKSARECMKRQSSLYEN